MFGPGEVQVIANKVTVKNKVAINLYDVFGFCSGYRAVPYFGKLEAFIRLPDMYQWNR